MRRTYFLITGIICALGLLSMLYGGVTVMLAYGFPPFLLLSALAMYIPLAAFALLCGLPSVMVWRWRVLAIPLVLLGLGVFLNYTAAVPIRAGSATAEFEAMTQVGTPHWVGDARHVELVVNDRQSPWSCRAICKRLLLDAGVSSVRVRLDADDIGLSFRAAKGAECAEVFQSPPKCILLTRNRAEPADLALTHAAGEVLLGPEVARLLGVMGLRLLTVRRVRDDEAAHIAKRLNPINSGLFRPKWSAGRLDDLGDQGLFYPRKLQDRADEGERDFLRRLGWQITDEPEGDLVTIDAALTPAARDDALSGPLPQRLHARLTAFSKRPMTPEETFTGTLEDSLVMMNKAWRETYFIDAATGKVVARSGLDTVELVRRGYSYLMLEYPDQRGRILQDYIANIVANREIHSQTLRNILEMYTTRPNRRNVDDLPPARSEYASYLALLENDEEARDHWLTQHFRIFGALFGLPPVDPAEITRPGDMEYALLTQCLVAHRDPESAQAQARTFASRKVDPAKGARGRAGTRALVILSARAGNLDEILDLMMRNWGLSADDTEDWRARAAKAMIKPEPCGYY